MSATCPALVPQLTKTVHLPFGPSFFRDPWHVPVHRVAWPGLAAIFLSILRGPPPRAISSGALCSANRIPERLSPGTFDYFLASHQIFHLFVLAAALAHYAGVLTAFDHWHRRVSGCPAR